jgi:hypothetical protein
MKMGPFAGIDQPAAGKLKVLNAHSAKLLIYMPFQPITMPCVEVLGCSLEMSVRSQVPGRERWDIPALRDNPALAKSVELVLRGEAGVLAARANPVTGRLLLLFEPEQFTLPVEQLIRGALSFGPLNSLEMGMTSEARRRNALRSLFIVELGCFLLKGAVLAGRCVPGGAIAAAAVFLLFHRHD